VVVEAEDTEEEEITTAAVTVVGPDPDLIPNHKNMFYKKCTINVNCTSKNPIA